MFFILEKAYMRLFRSVTVLFTWYNITLCFLSLTCVPFVFVLCFFFVLFFSLYDKKKVFYFQTASVISFFLLSQIQKKKTRKDTRKLKKKEKKKKEMEKQWGLKWLKVLFVLWLSGQHPDSSVSVVSDSDHWLLHSKELDQINVLSKKKKLLCCFCSV